jgi:spermidine/putrescine ABC transporter ATP-binding subunit
VPRAAGHLTLAGLTCRYGGVAAVDGIDLDIAPGEFVALLGPSGSGKTTTLMMVAGFTPPTAGDIALNGRSIAALPPERRNIGVVFQNYALFGHMTVADNIAFPLKMRGMDKQVIATKVREALALVRLDGLGERLPRQLSGGQQQRVALARALVFGPDLLLMDEPLGALDKNLREQVQVELRRIHRELGATILYVTHDQGEALTMADRVALMDKGRLVQVGRPDDLYERPVDRFVAEFIGESNLVPGRSAEAGWFVAAGGIRLPVAADRVQIAGGAEGLLVIRPEKLLLRPAGGSGQGFTGRVDERTYCGDFTRYRVRTDAGLDLWVKSPNNKAAFKAEEREQVFLGYAPDDACVISDGSWEP